MKKTLAGFFTGCAIAVFIIIAAASYQLYKNKYATIDPQLNEISGIEFDKSMKLWAINDGGDKAKVLTEKSLYLTLKILIGKI